MIRHVEDLPVLLGRLCQLRLKVFELHRRNQKANAAITILVGTLILITLIVDRCRNYLVHREYDEFLHLGHMQLVPENDLSNRVDVFAEVLVEKQRLGHL